MPPAATPQRPAPAPPEPTISGDAAASIVRWYALTAKGAPGYQRNQEGRR